MVFSSSSTVAPPLKSRKRPTMTSVPVDEDSGLLPGDLIPPTREETARLNAMIEEHDITLLSSSWT